MAFASFWADTFDANYMHQWLIIRLLVMFALKSIANYKRALAFFPLKTWYHTDVPPKSMWKSVKQPLTLIRQYLQKETDRVQD